MSRPFGSDHRWLDAAVRLARTRPAAGRGKPSIGTLVVDDDEQILIGRAIDVEAALAEAGDFARGRTLYSTLAPAAGPVMNAAPARVVIGVDDPGQGGGLDRLRAAGIDVLVLGHPRCRALHEAHLCRITRRRPFVTLILAVSRDGMIGRRDGGSFPMPCDVAQRWVEVQQSLVDSHFPTERRGLTMEFAQPGPDTRVLPRSELVEVNGRVDYRKSLSMLADRNLSSLLVLGDQHNTERLLAAEAIDRFHLIEYDAEIGRHGIPATALGTIAGRLRAAGFSETSSRALGNDKLRSFEPGFRSRF